MLMLTMSLFKPAYYGFNLILKTEPCNALSTVQTCIKLSSILCGLPQGSILDPLLFLIYINNLPNCLQSGLARMYADNTTIISFVDKIFYNVEFELNEALKNLNEWLIANKLSFNVTKTEFMIIGSRQRLQTHDNNEFKNQN